MRFFSLSLLAGTLALGAAFAGGSLLSQATLMESSAEHLAHQSGSNNTVHRGSGRRQILAIVLPGVN